MASSSIYSFLEWGRGETAGTNRKRPTLGDKADLFQEKGDKSITLAFSFAKGVPFIIFNIFFYQTHYWGGTRPYRIFCRETILVQIIVLLAHFVMAQMESSIFSHYYK